MRKIFFAMAILLGAASMALAQDKKSEKIEGNGNLVTREVNVSPFDTLKASGIYELILSQGSKESVKIQADENLQQYFSVKNEGRNLVIEMKDIKGKNFNSKDKMKIYVSFRQLKGMKLKTVGGVSTEGLLTFDDVEIDNKSVGNISLKMNADKVDVSNKSVGNVVISGKAREAVVRNTGVGKLEAGDFVVQTMDIENTGIGTAEVNAQKNLKVKDNFLGKVSNRGSATMRKMNKVRV
ncbi:MAG: head GIN domain-containing protein [Candidatus Dadabacteria bacterium]